MASTHTRNQANTKELAREARHPNVGNVWRAIKAWPMARSALEERTNNETEFRVALAARGRKHTLQSISPKNVFETAPHQSLRHREANGRGQLTIAGGGAQ